MSDSFHNETLLKVIQNLTYISDRFYNGIKARRSIMKTAKLNDFLYSFAFYV